MKVQLKHKEAAATFNYTPIHSIYVHLCTGATKIVCNLQSSVRGRYLHDYGGSEAPAAAAAAAAQKGFIISNHIGRLVFVQLVCWILGF